MRSARPCCLYAHARRCGCDLGSDMESVAHTSAGGGDRVLARLDDEHREEVVGARQPRLPVKQPHLPLKPSESMWLYLTRKVIHDRVHNTMSLPGVSTEQVRAV